MHALNNDKLVNLSIQLLEESNHQHPANLAPERCPACWTRQMACDLVRYIHTEKSGEYDAQISKAA